MSTDLKAIGVSSDARELLYVFGDDPHYRLALHIHACAEAIKRMSRTEDSDQIANLVEAIADLSHLQFTISDVLSDAEQKAAQSVEGAAAAVAQ
jgi:hypothetical protein